MSITPKMVVGGTLGVIAVALGVKMFTDDDGSGESSGVIERGHGDNNRGEYGNRKHKHHEHGQHKHRHHDDEE